MKPRDPQAYAKSLIPPEKITNPESPVSYETATVIVTYRKKYKVLFILIYYLLK